MATTNHGNGDTFGEGGKTVHRWSVRDPRSLQYKSSYSVGGIWSGRDVCSARGSELESAEVRYLIGHMSATIHVYTCVYIHVRMHII